MALDEKPKKALRGLFQKTEVKQEKEETMPKIAEVSTPPHALKASKQADQAKVSPTNSTSHHIKAANNIVNKTNTADNTSGNANVTNNTVEIAQEVVQSTAVIPKIQYNFEYLKQERQNWVKDDYVSFLKRIDNAQTEAFLLKGKLISEVKNRFYENNKNGWNHFCTETLNMNYTTANQYIRVALEFDVTSHQRTDFGFEHFKALLPLPANSRVRILEKVDPNISVKHLRQLVADAIATSHTESVEGASTIRSGSQHGLTRPRHRVKPLIENLQKVKQELERIDMNMLSTEEQWSLYGAFKTLSERMSRMAHQISSPQSLKGEEYELTIS
jgi:flagellar basal body rod protein FlgB